MLVLAGVSINAIIGDNGVITNAQKANILNSCAILQEFLETQVGTDFDAIGTYENKVDYIVNKYPNYLYKPNASTSFITDSATGFIYYLINKDGLPEDVRKQLVGGDAGEKKYSNYAHFQDVYGVTKNLEVYYCSNGSSTRLGAADAEERDDPTRVVMSSSSNLGSYLKTKFPDIVKTDKDGNVLAENLTSIRSFELNNDTNVTSLSGLENLPGLTEIRIVNQTLDNLNGIENLLGVTSVYFENVNIADYSRMSTLENLNLLRMYNVDDTQVDNLCTGIESAKFSRLSTLKIYGFDSAGYGTAWGIENVKNSNVTKLDGFLKLNDVTKKAITNLHLNNNNIESLYKTNNNGQKESVLSGFTSVTELRLQANSLDDITALSDMVAVQKLYINGNQITSLDGIQAMTVLRELYAGNNDLGTGVDGTTKDSSTDALSALNGKNSITTLSLYKNEMKWVEYIASCSGIQSVDLTNCPNISDILTLLSIIDKVNYDDIYANLIVDSSDIERVPFINRTYDESGFRQIFAPNLRKNLKYLSLQNLILTKQVEVEGETEKQTVTITDSEEFSTIVNGVLSRLSGLLIVDLRDNNLLNEISFVKNVSSLVELDLRGTMVTTKYSSWDESKDWNGLELLNDYGNVNRLFIDDTNTTNKIDCKKFGQGISKLTREGANNSSFDGRNLYGLIATSQIYKTLEGCKTLTSLTLGKHDEWLNAISGGVLDLTGCSNLTFYSGIGINIGLRFPSSLKTAHLDYGHWNVSFASGTFLDYLRFKDGWGSSYTAALTNKRWKQLDGIRVLRLEFQYTKLFCVGDVGETVNDEFKQYNLNISILSIQGIQSAWPNWSVDLANLGRIGGLTTFSAWGCDNITGLDSMGTCSSLTYFGLSGATVSNISNLSFVSTMPNLQTLSILNAGIDVLYPLVNYNVDENGNVQPTGIVLGGLKSLNLSGCMLEDSIQKSVGFVDNVKILKYIYNTQKGKNINFTFDISGNKFTNPSGILN